MKIQEMIRQLRAEQELLNTAIAKLEAIVATRSESGTAERRRGRPRGKKRKTPGADSREERESSVKQA
jgi:hypothetical protein